MSFSSPVHACNVSRSVVFFKMANSMSVNHLFTNNPPTEEIKVLFKRQRHKYFCQTKSGDAHRNISRFYCEAEAAIAVLEEKYLQPAVKLPGIQHLIAGRSMVVNALRKIHSNICRKLRSSANISSPWRSDFTMDIPREIFDIICKYIVERNSYGHTYKETRACVDISIDNIRKARFVFEYMNAEGVIMPKVEMFRKKLPIRQEGSLERSEVVISCAKPLKLKYYKNSELLSVHFHYGYWNIFGVPQH